MFSIPTVIAELSQRGFLITEADVNDAISRGALHASTVGGETRINLDAALIFARNAKGELRGDGMRLHGVTDRSSIHS